MFDKFEQEEVYQVPKQGRIGNVGIMLIPTNPNCLEISTRRIIKEGHAIRDKCGYTIGGETGCELFELLWTVPGIESLLLRDRYSMLVSKAVSFT